MKKDLIKLGQELALRVPYCPIERNFESYSQKVTVRLGYGISDNFDVRKQSDLIGFVGAKVDWSDLPRALQQKIDTEMTAAAKDLMESMNQFIDEQFAQEIQALCMDRICGDTTDLSSAQDHSQLFIKAIYARLHKLNESLVHFPRPAVFESFTVERNFVADKPAHIDPSIWGDDHTVLLRISESGILFPKEEWGLSYCYNIFYAMPYIVYFCTKLFYTLKACAEREAKNASS